MSAPNREAFERLCQELEQGHALTLHDIADVFGIDFVYLLMGIVVPQPAWPQPWTMPFWQTTTWGGGAR